MNETFCLKKTQVVVFSINNVQPSHSKQEHEAVIKDATAQRKNAERFLGLLRRNSYSFTDG